MPTPAERRDLRQAWKHLDKAIEAIGQIPVAEKPAPYPRDPHKLQAQQEISDARRIIDRVEQGRSH